MWGGGSVEGGAWRCVDFARQGTTWERSESAALQTLWEHESVGASEDATVQRLLGRESLAASRSPHGDARSRKRAVRAPPPLRYYRLVRAAAGACAGSSAPPTVLVGIDLAGDVVTGSTHGT